VTDEAMPAGALSCPRRVTLPRGASARSAGHTLRLFRRNLGLEDPRFLQGGRAPLPAVPVQYLNAAHTGVNRGKQLPEAVRLVPTYFDA